MTIDHSYITHDKFFCLWHLFFCDDYVLIDWLAMQDFYLWQCLCLSLSKGFMVFTIDYTIISRGIVTYRVCTKDWLASTSCYLYLLYTVYIWNHCFYHRNLKVGILFSGIQGAGDCNSPSQVSLLSSNTLTIISKYKVTVGGV